MKLDKMLILLIIFAVSFSACSEERKTGETQSLTVKSVFEEGGRIPEKYTCDGADISPPLYIEGLKEGVKSLVIICEDPDAPKGVFTHWIAWNVEPASEIPENVPKTRVVDHPKMIQGINDFGKIGYNGPCPPGGEHRYYFKVYALDTLLQGDYNRQDLLRSIEGHVLQYGEIYGVYSR